MKKYKINKKEIIKGLLLSLLVFLIPIVCYPIGSNPKDIWIAAFIVNLGMLILWVIIRQGLFSTSSYGARKLGVAFKEHKRNKLGAYYEKTTETKQVKSPLELEKASLNKSIQGLLVMAVFTLIEFVIMILVIFI